MSASAEMPRYQCHKKVWALKIKSIERDATTRLDFEDARYAAIQVSYAWDEKHKPAAGGYYVVYEDGYRSYSPADAFESGYTLLDAAPTLPDAQAVGDERAAFEGWIERYSKGKPYWSDARVEICRDTWNARAALSAAAGEWQPIETAPKGVKGFCWMQLAWGVDGDKSIAHGMRWGDRFFVCATFYCLGQKKQYEFREIEVHPTHWMPLPSLPVAAIAAASKGDGHE